MRYFGPCATYAQADVFHRGCELYTVVPTVQRQGACIMLKVIYQSINGL